MSKLLVRFTLEGTGFRRWMRQLGSNHTSGKAGGAAKLVFSVARQTQG